MVAEPLTNPFLDEFEQQQLAPVRKLWSVTTLISAGLGTSRPLVYWGKKYTAEFAIDSHDAIGAMIKRGDIAGAVEYVAKASDRHARQAGERGTALHAAFEAIALGQTPVIPEGCEAYVKHFERWLATYSPEFVLAEAPVYNLTYGYAGTTDGIMLIDGHTLLFDYKTNEHAPDSGKMRPPFPEIALQLAAYRYAEEIGLISEQRYASGRRYYVYDPSNRHERMLDVHGALSIVITPYDCFAVPVRVDESVFDTFLHVMACAEFQLNEARGLFGPQYVARTAGDDP